MAKIDLAKLVPYKKTLWAPIINAQMFNPNFQRQLEKIIFGGHKQVIIEPKKGVCLGYPIILYNIKHAPPLLDIHIDYKFAGSFAYVKGDPEKFMRNLEIAKKRDGLTQSCYVEDLLPKRPMPSYKVHHIDDDSIRLETKIIYLSK